MFRLQVVIFGAIFAAVWALPCFIKVIKIQQQPQATTQPPTTNTGGTIDPRLSKLIACDDETIPCDTGIRAFAAAAAPAPKKPPVCGQRFISSLDPSNGVTTLGAHPWLAYIVNQMGYTASGALIDKYYVITAAHKVLLHMNNPSTLKVYMGVHAPAKTLAKAEMRRVDQIHVHPLFEPDTLKNDIAVLRLNTPVTPGKNVNIGTICLPQNSENYIGKKCLVAGWGSSLYGTVDDDGAQQKQIRVPIVDFETCYEEMSQEKALGSNVDKYLDRKQHLCVGGQLNKDVCNESGGTPIVCQNETSKKFSVVGLLSWGVGCGKKGVYEIFVDVFKYRNWIEAISRDFYS